MQAHANLISVEEAAAVIGCTTGRVRQLLREAKLKGEKLSPKAWVVYRKDAIRVGKETPSTGRPRNGRRAG